MKRNQSSLYVFENLNHKELFTKTELVVVEYIQSHLEEIPQMNISELASATYSSNGTIIRICRKIGCDGFKEFKMKLLQHTETNKFVHKTVDFSFPFQVGDSTTDIVHNMTALYRDGLDVLQESLDPNLLNRIVDMILNSNRLFLYGIGDSQITAEQFANKLIKIGKFAIISTKNNETIPISYNVSKKDCALFISYSGANHLLDDSISVLKRRNIPIISITANKESKCARYSTEYIYIPKLEENYDSKIATFYSQFAFRYILDVLYALLYNKTK